MPRTRKGAGKTTQSQAVKSTSKSIDQLRKQARELLKKAGRNVREVRREVSQLKKAGVVSSRINTRNYLPSKYMLRKLAANADILRGEAVAVRAPKSVREKYKAKGIFEERGATLIVPREYENQRTRISRGLVEISRELKMGQEQRLILPFKATDMEGVAHKLLDDPTLDGMKKPDELFGFRLFGHNMNTIGFPTAEELANYILTHYQHLFSGKNGREGVKHFQLFKFKAKDSQLKASPEEGRIYHPRKSEDRRGPKDFIINKRRERDAIRKQKQREKETPEQYQKRIAEQRIRQARLRQRKFLGD